MHTCLGGEVGGLEAVLQLADALADVVGCASDFEEADEIVGGP